MNRPRVYTCPQSWAPLPPCSRFLLVIFYTCTVYMFIAVFTAARTWKQPNVHQWRNGSPLLTVRPLVWCHRVPLSASLTSPHPLLMTPQLPLCCFPPPCPPPVLSPTPSFHLRASAKAGWPHKGNSLLPRNFPKQKFWGPSASVWSELCLQPRLHLRPWSASGPFHLAPNDQELPPSPILSLLPAPAVGPVDVPASRSPGLDSGPVALGPSPHSEHRAQTSAVPLLYFSSPPSPVPFVRSLFHLFPLPPIRASSDIVYRYAHSKSSLIQSIPWEVLACTECEWAVGSDSVHVRAQSCPTLCDPMDCNSWGSSVHGIFQGRLSE